jgi:pimeloyl-ACP methyl ester carboxylesterase
MRSLLRAAALLLLAFTTALSAAAPATALDDAPSHFASLDGVRIHYKTLGRGRTAIVFVHGFAGDMTVWRDQVSRFEKIARVVVIDLPGHGQSDKPVAAYTMKFMARAVKAVVDDAHIDRAVLVGHSAGAGVIRQFDRAFPWKTRALVSVDGALWMKNPAEVGEQAAAHMRGEHFTDNLAAMLEAMMPAASAEVRQTVTHAAAAVPQHVALSYVSGMFDPAAWKEDHIVVPLLIVNQSGPFWNDEYVRAMRALADDIDYQTIDGVDHFLMLEKPAEFNSRLEKWLTKKQLLR